MNRSAFTGLPLPLSRNNGVSRVTGINKHGAETLQCGRRRAVRSCAESPPLDKLLSRAKRELSRNGLDITSMEWKSRVLTVFVAREDGEGATADDCADASSVLGEVIEEGLYLGDREYTLEISTPGAAHVLTQKHELEAFRGFPVCVKTNTDLKGKNMFWGTLGQCDEADIRIAVKGRMVKVRVEIVVEIRLCTANEVDQEAAR